jgi:hypothetical protein
VLLGWDHPFRNCIAVYMARRLGTGDPRKRGTERLGTGVTAVSYVKRNNGTRLRIHGTPTPWLVCLLLHNTPHGVGCGFQMGPQHLGGLWWMLSIPIIWTSGQAVHHTVQAPREPHTNGTAAPAQCEACAQQMLALAALLGRKTPVSHIRRALTATRLTLLMMLFPMARMTLVLGRACSACGAGISDDHGCG